MDTYDGFDAYLRDNATGGTIAALGGLYREIARDQEAFRAESGMSCPEGCGTCCRGFEPDTLRPEALFAAAYILAEEPALEAMLDDPRPDGSCPFWSEENPHHCRVYPGRGLICRLFGFSSRRDKGGALEFRPCKHMPQSHRGSFADGAGTKPKPPLAMADYASRLVALAPGATRGQFGPMVKEALAQLKYLRELSGSSMRGISSDA